ncbi:uncharacterized protein C19orf47-like [Dendronephthya gigantea]|uniref:uncharacterized protein C19orf47-like n=1 Tax=Dendronephthya gigantea TaxID=151771 RepID=UPI00106B64EC|nr:uncharacterized protein C19orf47-like [Dendronephthya gigantea]
MAEKDLKKWTTFFHEAGIPRGPASEYATLFCNHRLKDDLLADLTKEILNDIGITVMGDIMSILKHARAVYAKLEREKTSNQLVDSPKPLDRLTNDDPPIKTTTLIKKKKVVAKPSLKPKSDLIEKEAPTSTTIQKQIPTTQPKITVTVGDPPVAAKKKPAKTRMTLSERFASEQVPQPKVPQVSLGRSDLAETVAVKKVLAKSKPATERLPPNNKGAINMTSVKRKSAFERLGEDEASSLSRHMEDLSPKIKITKLAKPRVKSPPSKVISLVKNNESSVFKRLGETDQPPNLASTMRTDALTIHAIRGAGSRIVSDDPEKPAKSQSVLRPLKPIRAVQPVKPVSSVKARISDNTTKESSRKSVFSRLGS